MALKFWKQIPQVVQAVIWEMLRALWDRIAKLQERIAELEESLQTLQLQQEGLKQRLNQNSTNSSKPPSTDGLHVKRAPPRKRGQRKRGGQPGHPKHERTLLPSEECLEVIPVKPNTCQCCGEALTGSDPTPRRHQVWEIPPVAPEVREYQIHQLSCSACGQITTGCLPEGVPRGQFGPRLVSLVSLLTGVYRLSKRQIQQICRDLWQVPISLGQVCRLQNLTRQVLDPVVEEAREFVKTESANIDETSWVENKTRCWLWVAVTPFVAVFFIRATRGAKVLQEMIGTKYEKIVTSDRAKAYDTLPLTKRQLCWAHLRRDFQAMIDRENKGSPIGERLLFLADMLLSAWARVRSGERTRRRWFLPFLEDVRHDVNVELQAGAACGCAKTAATCRELLAREEALWTFAFVEGVEPTNNAGERAILPPVQYRKLSYGTDSERGSRFLENLYTVAASCRLQGRNPWGYLTACHQAHFQQQPRPSLLPPPNRV